MLLLLQVIASPTPANVASFAASFIEQFPTFIANVIIGLLLVIPVVLFVIHAIRFMKQFPSPQVNTSNGKANLFANRDAMRDFANMIAQFALLWLIFAVPIFSAWLTVSVVTSTSPSSLLDLSTQATATAFAVQVSATTQSQGVTATARALPMNTPNAAEMAPGSTAAAAAATTGASAATSATNLTGGTAETASTTSVTGGTASRVITPTPSTVATVIPLDGVFGPLDPKVEDYRRYLVAAFIALITSLIEIFLILVYGAYFINDPQNANQPLGLPPAAVRVFLIVIIVFVILLFTLLPDTWGSNKTTVLLIGLLTTVVGFYFGSHQQNDCTTQAAAHPIFTLKFESTTIPPANRGHVAAHILEDVTPLVQNGPPLITIYLLQNNGIPLPNSTVTAALSKSDKGVVFDFSRVLLPTTEDTSYIVVVQSPLSVVCGDRLTFIATTPAPTPPNNPAPVAS